MLSAFQNTMLEAIRRPNGELTDSSFFANYSDEELHARLSIYRNNYFSSLIDVLKDTFPTVEKLVGEEFFTAMSKIYIENHPTSNPVLINYGSDMPVFLEAFQPLESLPYIADVCRLDLYRHKAWYANAAQSLDIDVFSSLDTSAVADSQVDLHPSLYLLHSRYSIFAIWQLSHGDADSSDQTDSQKAEYVLVVRPENEVEMYQLDLGIYMFIHELKAGRTIGEALHLSIDADDSFNPTEAINFLISTGLVTGLKTNN